MVAYAAKLVSDKSDAGQLSRVVSVLDGAMRGCKDISKFDYIC